MCVSLFWCLWKAFARSTNNIHGLCQVHTQNYEGDIAKSMAAIQKQSPGVAIGSYINLTLQNTGVKDESYNTRLTIEGRDADEVERVAAELIAISNGSRFEGEPL